MQSLPIKELPCKNVPIKTALLSVYDKRGIVDFARALHERGIQLISTGGTYNLIMTEKIPVMNISDFTEFPEIMDGRVKTLHPKVYGGLLCIRDDENHIITMNEHDLQEIDLVVSNLYPFEKICREQSDYQLIIENIDIGGPTMIRAAAKNHAYVTVLTDPEDYPQFLSELNENNGGTVYNFRQKMAAKAFARTALYDTMIFNWFENFSNINPSRDYTIGGHLLQEMRYGENPHQKAAFYATGEHRPGVTTAVSVQGKQLSYNNINDADAAYELVAEFHPSLEPACVIVKHSNPCGVAVALTCVEAYRRALACDPISAFGGVVAFNCDLDAETAREVVKLFTEVIIAPVISKEAKEIFAEKPNIRLLEVGGLPDPHSLGTLVKTVAGGFLIQTRDNSILEDQKFEIVTKRFPTRQEIEDMKIAFRVVKHVKSNAIVYVKEKCTVGIGAGQMSRVDSARIAGMKAKEASRVMGLKESLTLGAVVASDAFYPFADGLLEAIKIGVTAVIQPGGSMRDSEVIEMADNHNIAMIFTGIRNFRH
ncbi:IMP cyclohydrolase / Phosphoribosylaminoimidazolecarboxamide formyltransferase [Liberibacter crescens BT-1]|uniref:Bifunctional purine biosynthesis protein PurH n=1 Tax=Liberibacter crescens (strain BT-1) TaxID=1215343 RepID=L0EUJ0_LIBCB|nr:bifunctional phosphoribosylaminoimidazolecarboxamide formyltransferase/IMP cyclohydrolase [Liberibacter crescens]AGA65224.1 IMP cyclohydrolase / Phosphoribosylaminoimidazolecarboxamide formyltransferase [Liberibacter crescens BT-1]AMC13174.1 phosphoribosylaminoimidazolecarboxamide formyltransferase [Liberibacter crescens]